MTGVCRHFTAAPSVIFKQAVFLLACLTLAIPKIQTQAVDFWSLWRRCARILLMGRSAIAHSLSNQLK